MLPLLLFALVAVAAGCVTSIDPRQVPEGATPDPTATPAPIDLAHDELAHDSRLEWWYYSGHLESESGREFGFHFVVFKADDSIGEPNLVAQLGILDVETGEHHTASRAEAGFRTVGDGPMTVAITNWVLDISPIAGNHRVTGTDGDVELSLQLEATAPVMLHNDIGWLPTEAGATYYYSWPRQSAVGELVIGGEKFAVTGAAWFDHQWGDFFVLGKPAGWQWFAVQLDDGASLMITENRGIDGRVADTYGTYMSPEGDVKGLRSETDGIRVVPGGEWTSPTTGATYPSGWALEIDSLGMDLVLIPVENDQEVQGGLPAASTYWEGKAWLGGTQNSQPISGNAYVELSGYADPEPIEWLNR